MILYPTLVLSRCSPKLINLCVWPWTMWNIIFYVTLLMCVCKEGWQKIDKVFEGFFVDNFDFLLSSEKNCQTNKSYFTIYVMKGLKCSFLLHIPCFSSIFWELIHLILPRGFEWLMWLLNMTKNSWLLLKNQHLMSSSELMLMDIECSINFRNKPTKMSTQMDNLIEGCKINDNKFYSF